MTGLLIAVFLGWLGGYRFYKRQYLLGVIYLLTGGLFCIGWIIDIISAFKEYKGKKLSITTNVVGTFAECQKDASIQRKDIIESLSVNSPLTLETSYYQGSPYFLVVDPVSGMDIGALPHDCSLTLKTQYPNAVIRASLLVKDAEHPVIQLEG